MEKAYLEIQQRGFDGKFVVWESQWPWVVSGEITLDSTEHYEQLKELGGHAWFKMWTPIEVFCSKFEATKYCKKRFGRNCFKENDKVAISFP